MGAWALENGSTRLKGGPSLGGGQEGPSFYFALILSMVALRQSYRNRAFISFFSFILFWP